MADSFIGSSYITFITTGISIYLGYRTYRLNERKFQLDQEVAKDKQQLKAKDERIALLEDHIASGTLTSCDFLDVVIVGSQNAGKTTLAALWSKTFSQKTHYKQSFNVEVYESEIAILESVRRKHRDLDIEMDEEQSLRFRIHVFPGEVGWQDEACAFIGSQTAPIVPVFLLDGAFADGRLTKEKEVNDYFSQSFVSQLTNNLARINMNAPRAIVAVSKADTHPEMWAKNPDYFSGGLHFQSVFSQVKTAFKNTDFDVIPLSAKTNLGVYTLRDQIIQRILERRLDGKAIFQRLKNMAKIQGELGEL